MAAQRIRWTRRQPFVDANVLESRLLVFDLLIQLLDQRERGVRHLLVVVPPLPHQAVRIVVHLRRVGDVVALPGIRLVLFRLLLDVTEIALSDVQQPVRHHARRARDFVDEVARRRRLRRGQDLSAQRLCHVPRRPPGFGPDGDRGSCHVAQQPDGHLAVEKHVLDELHDLRVAFRDRESG
jgi:hypothetical protein